MFTTIEQVTDLTGYTVSQETIVMAQAIIEAYTGRVEADVLSATDMALLGHAAAYQSAYMHNDEAKVFSQVAATQISQFGTLVSFRQDGASPWIAPLAIIACAKLSWRGVRSIKTGGIFSTPVPASRWATE